MTVSDLGVTLKELVAETERVFRHCCDAAQHPNSVDFPSLSLYRHMIHMADGVDVLCSASAVVAATPLLRSMLEALFALTYIHEKDYEQRSLCWLCAYIHQEIELKEKINPGTEKGNKFYLEAREQLPGFPEPRSDSEADLTKGIENLKGELAKPWMIDIDNEFNRRWNKRKGKNEGKRSSPPKWYQLFGGPSNLYNMADKIGRLPMYQVLYAEWSATVHGTAVASQLFLDEDGNAEFRDLHDPHGLEDTYQAAFDFLVMGTRKMLERFSRKGKEEGK